MKRTVNFKLYVASLILFFGFIVVAFVSGVMDYANDSLLIIIVLSILYIYSGDFKTDNRVYLVVVLGFVLHNMGVFGFYSQSPVFIQWDHITHMFGSFAATRVVYNFFVKEKLMNTLSKKVVLSLFIVLIALGVGAFVEFLEFIGYFLIGEGAGVFGHGLGDINTEFFNSEWFNTMFDMLYNMVGAILGLIFGRFLIKN